MTNERVDLLRLAADDCEAEANNQLREAPNLGPTKEQRNRMDAANIMKRVAALRLWADEMERSVEPPASHQHCSTCTCGMPASADCTEAYHRQAAAAGTTICAFCRQPLNRPAEPT